MHDVDPLATDIPSFQSPCMDEEPDGAVVPPPPPPPQATATNTSMTAACRRERNIWLTPRKRGLVPNAASPRSSTHNVRRASSLRQTGTRVEGSDGRNSGRRAHTSARATPPSGALFERFGGHRRRGGRRASVVGPWQRFSPHTFSALICTEPELGDTQRGFAADFNQITSNCSNDNVSDCLVMT